MKLRFQKERKDNEWTETIFEEIIIERFPKLLKEVNPTYPRSSANPKKATHKYIILK